MNLRRFHALIAAIVALAAASSTVVAENWTGTADTLWTNTSNWDTFTVPGSGGTANFIDAGNGNTNISLGGASQPIGTISFDTASAAAYTLGVLSSGDAFNFDPNGTIAVGSTVTTAQTINAGIVANGGLNINVANGTTIGLTLAGVISGNGPVSFGGIGGVTLSGENTYSGGTSFPNVAAQPVIRIAVDSDGTGGSLTKGAFGTGTITPSSSFPARLVPSGANRTVGNNLDLTNGSLFVGTGTTVAGQNSLTLTGNITTGSTTRNISNQLSSTATLTIALPDFSSTITRGGIFQFQANQGQSGSTTVLNSVVNEGTNSIIAQNGVNLIVNSPQGDRRRWLVTRDAATQVPATATFNGDFTGSTANNDNLITVDNGGKATFNGIVNRPGGPLTIGNAAATLEGGTMATFNNTTSVAAVTVRQSAVANFNGATTVNSTFTTNGVGSTAYINQPFDVTGTFAVEASSVVYVNAPTTYSGTASQAMNIQLTSAAEQTALVVNSTLTRTGAATSPVRVATGTLAGNGGTIFAPVSILTSGNGPSYLAPGTPAPSGGANTTPSYRNGAGKLTIGASGNPFDLGFTGTTNCSGCNFYAEIGGTTPGSGYDQVEVNGTATIGSATATRGTLTVGLINGFTRPAGDTSFEILKATTLANTNNNYFTTVNLPNNDTTNWSVSYTATSVLVNALGTGDFNHDGIVDAGDYVVWRKSDGTPGGYSAFRRNFGNTVPGSGSGLETAGVPEPGTITLLAMGLAVMACPRRASRNR